MPKPSLQPSPPQEERGTTSQRDSPPRWKEPQRPHELLNGDDRETAIVSKSTRSATDGPANEETTQIQTSPPNASSTIAEEVRPSVAIQPIILTTTGPKGCGRIHNTAVRLGRDITSRAGSSWVSAAYND